MPDIRPVPRIQENPIPANLIEKWKMPIKDDGFNSNLNNIYINAKDLLEQHNKKYDKDTYMNLCLLYNSLETLIRIYYPHLNINDLNNFNLVLDESKKQNKLTNV